tara:strand:+ start:167 stop:334 length:168 start_codon:yes stop_codon:yes gene_type:complete
MKICFVCEEELTHKSPPVEIWHRPDGSAHTDCVWRLAKFVMNVQMEMESNDVEDE